MVTPAARREAVAHLRVAFEVSERRACSTLCSDRTSVRYRSRRPSDAAARSRLRELAAVIRQETNCQRLLVFEPEAEGKQRVVIAHGVRRLAVRDAPEDLALVEIDRADPRVRRFEQRESLYGQTTTAAALRR